MRFFRSARSFSRASLLPGDSKCRSQANHAATPKVHQKPARSRSTEATVIGSMRPPGRWIPFREKRTSTDRPAVCQRRRFQTLKRGTPFSGYRMPSDEDEMLRSMGLRSVDDLFSYLPESVRIPKLDLADGRPEDEVVERVTTMLSANRTMADMPT